MELKPVPLNTDLVKRFDATDRSTWDKSTYYSALEEVGLMKAYSQWLIGKFTYEYQKKFGYGARTELCKACRVLKYNTITRYRDIYAKFVEQDENFKLSNFLPANGYIPFELIGMAAREDDPIGALNKLHDSNATTIEQATAVLAEWRNEREGKQKAIEGEIVEEGNEKPVEIEEDTRPPKPRLFVEWNYKTETWQVISTREACERLDWSRVDFLKEVLAENEVLSKDTEKDSSQV